MRAALIVAVFAAFMASRVFGLHSHIAHSDERAVVEHVHDADHEAHSERITAPAAEGAAGHLDAHLVHGDIDLDQPAGAAAKSKLLNGVAAVIGLLATLLLIIPALASPVLQPPHRPPKLRFRPYLLPPSQAPPRAA